MQSRILRTSSSPQAGPQADELAPELACDLQHRLGRITRNRDSHNQRQRRLGRRTQLELPGHEHLPRADTHR